MCEQFIPGRYLISHLLFSKILLQALLKMKISFCVFFILSAYSENTKKVFKRIRRIPQIQVHKIVSVYAERIFASMEKTQRYTKLRVSWQIMIQHEFFLAPFFLYKMGWIKPKNHYTATVLLKGLSILSNRLRFT